MRIVRLFTGVVLIGLGIAFIAVGNAMGTLGGVATAAICGVPLLLFGLVVAFLGLLGRQQQQQQMQQQQSVVIVPQYAPPAAPPAYVQPPAPAPPSDARAQSPEPRVGETPRKFCPACGSHYPPEYNVCPRDGSALKALQ